MDREIYTEFSDSPNPVIAAIDKYINHPSILKINEQGFLKSKFKFKYATGNCVLKVIDDLNAKKSFQKDNIPPKMLKDNKDICSLVLTNDIRNCIDNTTFPMSQKKADISPLFKKNDRLMKDNYRAVSILPMFSKIYEKIIYFQIDDFFNDIFSKYLWFQERA